tara:strand:- start:182 stop:544 length:363 start_codon:yes stop_codon:yes gene_type:complete
MINRPIVPITLVGKYNGVDLLGYLDSGSDLSVISKDFADFIGVDYIEEAEISGITGDSMKVDFGYISIIFGKESEKYQFSVSVLVSKKEDSRIIIGRKGFFEQFEITFIEGENKVVFEKV